MNRSFLVINPFGIGDVLFSTPLLRQLHEAHPGAKIYYLCNRRTSTFLKSHPLITKLFIYERDEFRAAEKRSFWEGAWMLISFLNEIRKEHIDVAIDLSLNTKFGLYALLAGIPVRAGFDHKKRGRFLNRKLPLAGFDSKNVIEYYLDILSLIGIQPRISPMEIYSDETSRSWAQQIVKPGKLVIGIAPCGGQAFGASAGLKRWPEGHFVELINRLVERYHPQILVFAGPNEKVEMERILSRLNLEAREVIQGFADRSFEEIVALTGLCDFFISNDTGLLRVAIAFGKKTLAFFGPADERVYGPFPVNPERHRVLTHPVSCRPCYKHFRLPECQRQVACMTGVSVDEAFRACGELLTAGEKRH
jgi:lipopolysaccharide heptosyltransferase II